MDGRQDAPALTGHRGDIDDTSPLTAVSHVGQRSLATEKRPFKIDVQHSIPLFLCHISEITQGTDTGVVHQDIQSIEVFDGPFNCAPHVILSAHVSFNRQHPVAEGLGRRFQCR